MMTALSVSSKLTWRAFELNPVAAAVLVEQVSLVGVSCIRSGSKKVLAQATMGTAGGKKFLYYSVLKAAILFLSYGPFSCFCQGEKQVELVFGLIFQPVANIVLFNRIRGNWSV
ncbi:MAG: hypothetical protein HWN68_03660 [Desulfobacterales bacterium]|nr:hypothetical protein [Desulfobacterales bacterium]